GFTGAPQPTITIFSGPPEGVSIEAADSASLHHLTIEGSIPTSPTQRSGQGLRVSAKLLNLDDVIVRAANAAPGAAGKGGEPAAGGAAATGSKGATDHCGGHSAAAQGANANSNNPEGLPAGNICTKTPAAQGSAGISGLDG